MKRVQYGAEAFDTSDEIASLLLELGATLARAGSAEVVTVPAVATDGTVHRLEFVLGPATHLSVQSERSSRLPEPVYEQAADTIRSILARNTPRRYSMMSSTDPEQGAGSYLDEY